MSATALLLNVCASGLVPKRFGAYNTSFPGHGLIRHARGRRVLVIYATFMYRLGIKLGSLSQPDYGFINELAQLTQLRQMDRMSLQQEDCHEG
jgi:hypothetical protein